MIESETSCFRLEASNFDLGESTELVCMFAQLTYNGFNKQIAAVMQIAVNKIIDKSIGIDYYPIKQQRFASDTWSPSRVSSTTNINKASTNAT